MQVDSSIATASLVSSTAVPSSSSSLLIDLNEPIEPLQRKRGHSAQSVLSNSLHEFTEADLVPKGEGNVIVSKLKQLGNDSSQVYVQRGGGKHDDIHGDSNYSDKEDHAGLPGNISSAACTSDRRARWSFDMRKQLLLATNYSDSNESFSESYYSTKKDGGNHLSSSLESMSGSSSGLVGRARPTLSTQTLVTTDMINSSASYCVQEKIYVRKNSKESKRNARHQRNYSYPLSHVEVRRRRYDTNEFLFHSSHDIEGTVVSLEDRVDVMGQDDDDEDRDGDGEVAGERRATNAMNVRGSLSDGDGDDWGESAVQMNAQDLELLSHPQSSSSRISSTAEPTGLKSITRTDENATVRRSSQRTRPKPHQGHLNADSSSDNSDSVGYFDISPDEVLDDDAESNGG